MGKAALFAIAAFSLLGGYYTFSSQQGMLSTTESVAEHQYEVLSRNAALTGFELAKQQLAKDFNNTSTIPLTPYETGYFNVHISASGDLRNVTSVGQVFTPEGDVKIYQVFAKFRQEAQNKIPKEPPAFMKYAILSENDLDLSGNILVDTVKVEGTEATEFNANVHTNGILRTNGKAARIKGFGTYKVSEDVKFDDVLFQPYVNPAREAVVKRVSEGVEIPYASFDGQAMADKAATLYDGGVDQVTEGDLTLSGEYDFSSQGTPENPYVWHVKGNLTASGNTQIKGYVMFIVDGDITFSGNFQQGEHTHGSENNVAFYTEGNMTVEGTTDLLWGQIFAKGDVTLSGEPTIYGNITAGGTVTVDGTPKVKYYPASPALTTIWQDPETRLKLIAYAER